MAIIEERPVSMAEVNSLVGTGEKADSIRQFIKQFKIISFEDAKKMKDELSGLGLLKLKESYIVKITDFVPKDAGELNKILSDVSLDSEEVSKILNVTQNY
jgi:DNA-directed RNA polymerase subunit F